MLKDKKKSMKKKRSVFKRSTLVSLILVGVFLLAGGYFLWFAESPEPTKQEKEIAELIDELREFPPTWLEKKIDQCGLGALLETKKKPRCPEFVTDDLIKIGRPAVPELIRVMADKKSVPDYTRMWVAKALGVIKDSRAVVPLIYALEDEDIQSTVAHSLGDIGDVRAVKPLIDALEGGNTGAISSLSRLGDVRAVEPIIKGLKNYHPKSMYNGITAKALGRLGDTRAVDALVELLQNVEARTRRESAEALGKIGDRRGVDALVEALLQDDEERVRGAAAKALEKIGDPRAIEPLCTALELDDGNSFAQRHIVAALGKFGDERAVPFLEKAIKKSGEKWPRARLAIEKIRNRCVGAQKTDSKK